MKNKFYINRAGYLPDADKIAVVTVNGRFFSIVDPEKGSAVYEGRLSEPIYDKESDDTVRIADFSDFNRPGRYYIKIGIRRSRTFEISESVYRDVRSEVLTAIKLSRCGFDSYAHADEFDSELSPFLHRGAHKDSLSHSGRTYDLTGGWHTMGGFDKDVAQSAIVICELLYSLLVFPESFDRNERQAIIGEARWGMDFLLKMQDTDGGVFSDVHARKKFSNGMPDEDDDIRMLGDKSCLSTLRF